MLEFPALSVAVILIIWLLFVVSESEALNDVPDTVAAVPFTVTFDTPEVSDTVPLTVYVAAESLW